MTKLTVLSQALTATGTKHRLVIAATKPARVIEQLTIQQHNPIYAELTSLLKKAGLRKQNSPINYDAAVPDTRAEFLAGADFGALNIQTGPAVFTIRLGLSRDRRSYEFEISARNLSGEKAGPWKTERKTIAGARFRYRSYEELMLRNWKKWFKQARSLLTHPSK